nr:immunoglobulin light chain junction region [Macaca mulatta]
DHYCQVWDSSSQWVF